MSDIHIGHRLLPIFAALILLAPIVYSSDFDILLISLGLLYALIYLTLFDLREYRLPNIVTYPLILAGIVINGYYSFGVIEHYLIGAIAGYGVIWLLRAYYLKRRSIEAIGLGDAKLLAAAGAWLGWQALPFVLMIASFSAIIIYIFQYLRRKNIDSQTKIPFGPFLCVGFWVLWLAHNMPLGLHF